MLVLKRLVIGLVVVLVVLIAIGFLLPSHYRVERSAVVPASPAAVYAQIASFEAWRRWDPWTERDPAIAYAYEGPGVGKGAVQTWTSQGSGSGRLEITDADPPRRLDLSMSFDAGEHTARSAFVLEPVEGGTRVTWSMEGDLGMNPIARYVGLAFDRMIGADYERGLANLARVVAAGPPPAAPRAAPAEPDAPDDADPAPPAAPAP